MTKEEMLQKGISEEIADEIIESFSDSENPLLALKKAVSEDDLEEGNLFKAEDGEDEGKGEDDDDDYDEKYMKKYVKKYMMANKSSCKKMMKEIGLFGEKMEKAIDGIDTNADAAVIEMADLKPLLESQSDMAKAISTLAEIVTEISAKQDESYSLMHKAAKVTAIQAESLSGFMSEPQGRKGVIATEKTLQKAGDIDINKQAYKVLMKATYDKVPNAGLVISAFEASGQNINKLNGAQKQFILDLINKKEAN